MQPAPALPLLQLQRQNYRADSRPHRMQQRRHLLLGSTSLSNSAAGNSSGIFLLLALLFLHQHYLHRVLSTLSAYQLQPRVNSASAVAAQQFRLDCALAAVLF